MRTAFIENMMPFEPRREAYLADVTYGTNSEFGFDYLRDNMAVSLDGIVQRGHQFAIVDEVDSILVDEARTPLIISGEPETAAQIYYDFARVAATAVGHRSTRATRRAPPRPPAPTTSTTRSTRPSPSPSRASRRSSARCGSRTCTRRRTRSSSTTRPGAEGAVALPAATSTT